MNIDLRNALLQVSKLITKKDGSSPCGYGYVLEELAKNLEKLAQEPKLLDEFIEIYSLKD